MIPIRIGKAKNVQRKFTPGIAEKNTRRALRTKIAGSKRNTKRLDLIPRGAIFPKQRTIAGAEKRKLETEAEKQETTAVEKDPGKYEKRRKKKVMIFSVIGDARRRMPKMEEKDRRKEAELQSSGFCAKSKIPANPRPFSGSYRTFIPG